VLILRRIADRRKPTEEEYHTGPSAAGRESAAL
jgi:hypothetical protein